MEDTTLYSCFALLLGGLSWEGNGRYILRHGTTRLVHMGNTTVNRRTLENTPVKTRSFVVCMYSGAVEVTILVKVSLFQGLNCTEEVA